MARIRLVPQKREFFELFTKASSNAVDIARLLVELLDRFPADGTELISQVKEHEHTGDRLTHDVVDLLNRTFVTPFDREDIFALSRALDDVLDYAYSTVDEMEILTVLIGFAIGYLVPSWYREALAVSPGVDCGCC